MNPAAAAAAGAGLWAVLTAAAYAAITTAGPRARRLCRAWVARLTARDPGLCPATARQGGLTLACHLPEGHSIALVHLDRSRGEWTATTFGVETFAPQ